MTTEWLPPTAITADNSHRYAPYQVADKVVVETYIEPFMMDGERSYRCLWPQCQKEPYRGKHNAHVHVQKHLGYMKLFYCVTCLQEFSSEDIAKRHQKAATGGRVYPCSICDKGFTRKDYRNVHQEKCAEKQVAKTVAQLPTNDLI